MKKRARGLKSRGPAIYRRALLSAVATGFAVRCLPLRAAPSGPAIRFGLTPVFLSNDLELLDRMQGYLAQACNAPVQLVTRRTYQEITALLVSGQLDAALDLWFSLRRF